MEETSKQENERDQEEEEEIIGLNKCFNVKFRLGPIRFDFNPVVTIFSALIIWAFVIWCIKEPDSSLKEMNKWKDWITRTWTWFYIGTQDVWAVFIVILYFSKYANIKLGGDDEKPEYNDATYFTMLFAAGIGIGLFYFGVAEPIFHYAPGQYGNRYWNRWGISSLSVYFSNNSSEDWRFQWVKNESKLLFIVDTWLFQLKVHFSRSSFSNKFFKYKKERKIFEDFLSFSTRLRCCLIGYRSLGFFSLWIPIMLD